MTGDENGQGVSRWSGQEKAMGLEMSGLKGEARSFAHGVGMVKEQERHVKENSKVLNPRNHTHSLVTGAHRGAYFKDASHMSSV